MSKCLVSENNLSGTSRLPDHYSDDESSSQYLHISDCTTGEPINDRSPLSENFRLSTSPAKPPRVFADSDCYDVPRSVQPAAYKTNRRDDYLNKKPSAPIDPFRSTKSRSQIAPPPPVNWGTFPKDGFNADSTRASVRSCHASFESTPTTRQQRARFESGPGGEIRRSTSHVGNDYLNTNDGNFENSTLPPPPRPPKPASLRRSKSKSESCSSLPTVANDNNYDIPPNGARIVIPELTKTKSQQERTSLKYNPSSSKVLNNVNLDQLYDFPVQSNQKSVCSLDTVVPLPQSVPRAGERQHSYHNAASGFFGTKENVFNYDYRPSLPTSSDDNGYPTTYDPEKDRSPRTPNSANLLSSSLLMDTPPAVNRDLKPRRKNSDSDNNVSPSTPVFNLAPPPAVRYPRQGNLAAPLQKSLNKSPTSHGLTPPRVPTRSVGGYVSAPHSREASYGDDNTYGNYGNNNILLNFGKPDDHVRNNNVVQKNKPVRLPEATDEIQYLDLDLESDTNSSPRTPNSVAVKASVKSSPSTKNGNHVVPISLPPASNSSSTVYKNVDFVRTQALNKTQIERNLEESHRNPQ